VQLLIKNNTAVIKRSTLISHEENYTTYCEGINITSVERSVQIILERSDTNAPERTAMFELLL
jgi:hypothetical protein